MNEEDTNYEDGETPVEAYFDAYDEWAEEQRRIKLEEEENE